MTFTHQTLLIAAIFCSNGTLFGMINTIPSIDHAITFHSTYKEKTNFWGMGSKMKALTANNPEWKNFLDSESETSKLFYFIDTLDKPIIAAILGTPGAIAFGIKFIKYNPEAQANLILLLEASACVTKDKCIWEDQDIDIATNILNMTTIEQIQHNVLSTSPLVTAAMHRKIKFVNLLLNRGFNIEAKDALNRTALMAVSEYGYSDMLDLLIERGANVHAETNQATPFLLAIASGNVEIIKKLIAAGACINKPNKYGQTPLKIAECRSFHIEKYKEIIQILLDNGATQ